MSKLVFRFFGLNIDSSNSFDPRQRRQKLVQHKIVYNQISATITQEVLSNPKAKVSKNCSPIFVFVMDQNIYTNL